MLELPLVLGDEEVVSTQRQCFNYLLLRQKPEQSSSLQS